MLDSVTSRDAGVYVCIAQNSAGTVVKHFTLQVLGACFLSFVDDTLVIRERFRYDVQSWARVARLHCSA